MRFVRLTCWAIIGLLLLNASGALSSLHMLAHHAHEPGMSICDHGDQSSTNEQDPAHGPFPAPTPEPGDDDCSICLGFAGLHLSIADAETCVVIAPVFAEPMLQGTQLGLVGVPLGASDARAPPVC